VIPARYERKEDDLGSNGSRRAGGQKRSWEEDKAPWQASDKSSWGAPDRGGAGDRGKRGGWEDKTPWQSEKSGGSDWGARRGGKEEKQSWEKTPWKQGDRGAGGDWAETGKSWEEGRGRRARGGRRVGKGKGRGSRGSKKQTPIAMPPEVKAIEEELWSMSRDALIMRCKVIRKDGAPQMEGRGSDPARYSDEEMQDYLFEVLTAAHRPAGLALTTPPEELRFKEELANQVKQSNPEAWHTFCNKSWGKYDPMLYPVDVLLRFLEGKEAPALQELVTEEMWVMSKGDLVTRCKMAVKLGAQPLEGYGRDPALYSEDDLRAYLAGLNPDLERDAPAEEEGDAGIEAEEDAGDIEVELEEEEEVQGNEDFLEPLPGEVQGNEDYLEPLPGEVP